MHLKLLHGSPPFPSAPSTDPTERGLSSGVMLGAGAKKEGGNPPTLNSSHDSDQIGDRTPSPTQET